MSCFFFVIYMVACWGSRWAAGACRRHHPLGLKCMIDAIARFMLHETNRLQFKREREGALA